MEPWLSGKGGEPGVFRVERADRQEGIMGFEQAWLSYGVLGKESDWRGIERICADPASPVMKNAVSELQKALGTMTGKEPVLCSGTD